MNKTYMVRVLKSERSSYWYVHHVGKVFTVEEENSRILKVIGDTFGYRVLHIDDVVVLSDAEVIQYKIDTANDELIAKTKEIRDLEAQLKSLTEIKESDIFAGARFTCSYYEKNLDPITIIKVTLGYNNVKYMVGGAVRNSHIVYDGGEMLTAKELVNRFNKSTTTKLKG